MRCRSRASGVLTTVGRKSASCDGFNVRVVTGRVLGARCGRASSSTACVLVNTVPAGHACCVKVTWPSGATQRRIESLARTGPASRIETIKMRMENSPDSTRNAATSAGNLPRGVIARAAADVGSGSSRPDAWGIDLPCPGCCSGPRNSREHGGKSSGCMLGKTTPW